MFNKNKLTSDDIKYIKSILYSSNKRNYKFIFIHASYLINMATDFLSSSQHLYNPSLDIFLNEINIAQKLKVDGIIVHLGKNVKESTNPDIVYNKIVNIEKSNQEILNKLNSQQIKVTTGFNQQLPSLGPRLQKINPETLQLIKVYESVTKLKNKNN